MSTPLPQRLAPVFDVDGDDLALVAHEAGPVDARRLKHPVASLRAQAHVITDALDAVVSGI